MNIQTVIANLLQTIEGKEKALKMYEEATLNSTGITHHVNAVTVHVLKINIDELKAILYDCMAVREADIIKDLEIKDLKRQNSDYNWQLYPDRMGQ